VEKAGALIAD